MFRKAIAWLKDKELSKRPEERRRIKRHFYQGFYVGLIFSVGCLLIQSWVVIPTALLFAVLLHKIEGFFWEL